MKLPPAFQSNNRRNDFCRARRGQTKIGISLVEDSPRRRIHEDRRAGGQIGIR
jgi:hypothetical protein